MSPQFLVRQGLRYSTPTTATFVSLTLHTIVLWAAVYFTVGIPKVAFLAVSAICITGILQPVMRFCHYTGMAKIGTSRAVTLRNTYPVLSVLIGITILGESITTLGFVGTALITGIVHPLRRYALVISDEPLFFAALVGPVSLISFAAYHALPVVGEKLVWNQKALLPFAFGGLFETLAVLLMLIAFTLGPVVIVSPIVATTPIWTLLFAALFLREVERISMASIMGALCVVFGVVVISLVD